MRQALIAGLVVGAIAPLVGAFVVQRRLSLLGDGIGHLAFTGVALGLFTGLAPLPTALVVASAGAIAVEIFRSRGVAGDLALAFLFYAGIAGGVVLVSLADGLDASLLSYLFGQILTVSRAEVIGIVVMGIGVLVVVATIGRGLFAIAIDEESARVAGLPVAGLGIALSVLVAITVVLAMRVVGVLLVAALMVLPVGAAQALARSFRGMLLGACGIGMLAVVGGLTIARAYPVAPGGVIVLVAAFCFAVCSLVGRRGARAAGRLVEHGPDEHHPHPHHG